MAIDETPIEEWQVSKNGRQFTSIKGPGGGVVWRKGDETIDAARLRRAVEIEAKRQAKATAADQGHASSSGKRGPGRPRGKGRKKDPTPGPTAAEPAAPSKPKVTADQLAGAAEVPLRVIGAFVGQQILGCQFCAQAMSANAGAAAADLANTDNPYMLNLLTWWHGIMTGMAGREGLAMFLLPPVIHHVAPAPMAAIISPIMGIPPRPEKSSSSRHAGHPSPGTPAKPTEPGAPPAPPGGAPEQSNGHIHKPTQADIDELMREREALMTQMRHGPNRPPYDARQEPQNVPGPTRTPSPDEVAGAAGSPIPPEALT